MSDKQQSYLQERTLFEEAVQIQSDSERSDFLEDACHDDPELRRRLEVLLEGHFKASDIPGSEPETILTTMGSQISEDIGSTIGPYKLLQKLGEGGFGFVYMADQKQPVKRRVALKIIKLGMDTKQVVGRFEGERQALAMMEHPNIAKVFDAGATDSGRPYFVMELVKGIPVTQYCDENNLTTQERLELFVPICKAIQHAHQKGVVHRDIKPTNIMITLHDGIPVPKVIDFGIAKATQQELTEHTIFTQYGQLIGTPAYMSPEQAEMSGLDIDTRSDIYSLGVLLYELITGRTPLDSKELMSGGYDEIRRRIREEEPAKPSTRVSTLIGKDLASLAKHRKTDPGKLSRNIRGDLDWIVMKALEKDRTRRYDTPNELVSDLKRFLNDEPVSAAAPSLVYQIQKLARRHKTAFRAAAAIVAVILIGSAAAISQAIRATNAEHLADQRAENERLAKEAESTQRQRAEELGEKAERELYYANILVADRHIEDGDIDRALQVLNECPPQYRHWEWGRLLYLCHQEVWSAKGDTSLVSSRLDTRGIRFDPRNDRVATLEIGGQLHVWRTMDGKELWTYGDEMNRVGSFRFSPDGAELALINGQGAIEIWDTQLWIRRHQIGPVNKERFRQVRVSRDRIVATSGSSRVALFDIDTGRELALLEGNPSAEFRGLAFDMEGQSVVSSGPDDLSYWRIDSQGRIVSSYHQQASDTSTLLDYNDEYAVWRTVEGNLQVKRVANGELQATLPIHPGGLRSLFFSPDNRLLCTVESNDTAKVWALASGKELCAFNSRFSRGAFSLDGERIVTSGNSRVVRIWDTASGRELRALKGHRDITAVANFSPDGQWVVSGDASGTIKLWRSDDGRERFEHSNWFFDVAVSRNDKRMASAHYDGIAKVWDIESGAELHTLRGHFHSIIAIDFSPNGDRIVTASRDETARIWDANTGKELLTLRGHTRELMRVAFSPDGRQVATGGWDSLTKIWDASTGQELLNLQGHSLPIHSLAWHPTKERIVTSSRDNTTKVWDTSTGTELFSLEGHDGVVTSVVFSPDGKLIVTGGLDRTIRLWDSESGKEISRMSTKTFIWSLNFSPDGERLLSASSEPQENRGTHSIEIWELESGRELLSIQAHDNQLQKAVWNKSGDRIVSASVDNTARVWESFPYRLEDFPGPSNSPLHERSQLYAAEYWRRRIAAEKHTANHSKQTTASTSAKIPRDWFPSRDSISVPEQLDLTEFYNALLNVSWHPDTSVIFFGFDLAELPTGTVTFSDVTFDVRGVVQLANNQKTWQDRFETEVRGIQVAQKVRRLHILHGANVSHHSKLPSLYGQAASYVMRYADGDAVEFSILYGRDLLHLLWRPGLGLEKAEEATIVWRGMNSSLLATTGPTGIPTDENELRLYKSVWENPRPDEEIISIDYVSTKTQGLLPFLIAITVEP